jgi:sialate O-acetylesterase
MRRLVLCAAVLAAGAAPAHADVKLPSLFSDGMVLQRGAKCPIWGTADPGEVVDILLEARAGPELTLGAGAKATADKDGKWQAALFRLGKDLAAGGPYTLTITGKNKITLKDVYIGEVWICSGQSNMGFALRGSHESKKDIENSKNRNIRLFTVAHTPADQPQSDVARNDKANVGKWVECGPDTAPGFSAVAYYFGRDLQKAVGCPVGLIHTSWGGTVAEAWTSRDALAADATLKAEILDPFPKAHEAAIANYPKLVEKYKKDLEAHKEAVEKAKKEGKDPPPAPRAPVDPKTSPNRPAVLYNGMIRPLQPFAFRGVIWYQGEANAGRAEQYRTLFPALIADWRKAWDNEDMPFLFVQLAPYGKPAGEGWARLREAQLRTTQTVKNTGMAVITDVGERDDVHPTRKQPVGARLALAARALAYGEKIEYSGPLFKELKVDGDQAIVNFSHVGKGLAVQGEGDLKGFTLAGEDKVFHPAKAVIKGDSVVVTSDKVAKPVAVRYGWASYPVVNLGNKDGLLASPFRSDDYPAESAKKADGK